MSQIAIHNLGRLHTATLGTSDERNQRVALDRNAHIMVARFATRCQSRTRSGRIGYTIIGRVGLDECRRLSAIHIDRLIFLFEH